MNLYPFRVLTIIVCFMVSGGGLTSFAQTEAVLKNFEANEFVSSSGYSLPYRILKPQDFNPAQRYPVVLFLHGAGERGNDNTSQLKNGVGDMFLIAGIRQKYPCYVVMPQCPKDDFWAQVKGDRTKTPPEFTFHYNEPPTASLDAVLELVKDLRMDASVDTSRIYITGLSMGGMGTFEAVGREPEIFAAAAPICGGGDAAAYTKKQAEVPFYVFHGDADPVVNVEYSRRMYQRLLELGGRVMYKEYPGVGHNSWDNAYREVTLIPWMFSKRRE